MVGSALMRNLSGKCDLITAARSELELTCQNSVNRFFQSQRPDVCIFAAAKVGGISANNSYPADFIFQNLAMATNAIHSAWKHGCSRFLYLGSTCIYPGDSPQPIQESHLLCGPLEPTNEAYAIAKIAGVKMCQHYRSQYGVCFHSAMPTNLYGPGDNYHPENSHVIPGLLRRFDQAKTDKKRAVTIWGTGQPRREFLHVDDLARGIVHLAGIENPPNLVNIGTGQDISIRDLSHLIARIVGFDGEIKFDHTKPNGSMLKRTDTTLINSLGWQPQIELTDGLTQTYTALKQSIQTGELREN